MTAVTDRDGRAPLHMAAHANDASRVVALLAAKADPNLQDNAGFTPLHLAAHEYAVEAARVLLKAGALVDPLNEHGNSPLFVATFNSRGRGEMITLLRDHGANPYLVNRHGQSPLELAKLIGNYDLEQFFK